MQRSRIPGVASSEQKGSQMGFTQLTSSIPVTVQGKGKGSAFAVIDYGEEHNLIWVVALDDSGEIWCSPNPKVRVRSNWTMGRSIISVAAANAAE